MYKIILTSSLNREEWAVKTVFSIMALVVSLAVIAYLLYLLFVAVLLGNLLTAVIMLYAIFATTIGGAYIAGLPHE